MSRKLTKVLTFIGWILTTFCLLILLGHTAFAQVRRNPQPEPFPSASPPTQCVPEASRKASWLLPTPTNNVLWKNLRSNAVSVWVPYKYQLRNNFQAQQLGPLPSGTIVFRSDDRLRAVDPTGKSSEPSLTISKQQRFTSFNAAESYVKETLNSTVKGLSDPSLREQGAKISVNQQKVSLSGRSTDRLIMEFDLTEVARRQQNQASTTRGKLVWYFPVDPQTGTLWGIQFFGSPEDFNSRATEFEKIACTFVSTF